MNNFPFLFYDITFASNLEATLEFHLGDRFCQSKGDLRLYLGKNIVAFRQVEPIGEIGERAWTLVEAHRD